MNLFLGPLQSNPNLNAPYDLPFTRTQSKTEKKILYFYLKLIPSVASVVLFFNRAEDVSDDRLIRLLLHLADE